MHILVIGADSNYAIERPYVRYLREVKGISRVDFFTAQNRFLEYYKKSILHKVLFRLGLSSILRKINQDLRDEISRNIPDAILVFKGMEIFPDTLQWIRAKGIKIANYNPDNPFIFSGKGSGNKNISESISLYDLHFTYNLETKKRLEDEYGAATSWLPFGYDIEKTLYDECEKLGEINELCFVGNPDPDRASFILELTSFDIPITVYGHGWNNFINNSKVKIGGFVAGNDLWKILRKYRGQINLMRRHNLDSHNMRTFEVPAIGGIMIAPNTTEHRMFFEDGKEVLLFNDAESCAEKARKLISLSQEDSKRIRDAARERSLASHYSYQHRAELVASELKKL
ncbi:MAG: glycosyltransferase family 1 protein [Cyclobacteriaceae bacterium]|nr:glycosyltransferase family 1 protein [Cyclobacteriaceae bacterium]